MENIRLFFILLRSDCFVQKHQNTIWPLICRVCVGASVFMFVCVYVCARAFVRSRKSKISDEATIIATTTATNITKRWMGRGGG